MVTPPPKTLAIVSPSTGTWADAGGPTFSGTALDGAGYSSTVTVRLYAGPAAGGSPVTSWTTQRSGTAWVTTVPDPLADGQYTAQAEQENAGGAVTRSAAVTFTVDSVAPQVSLAAPPGGSSVADSTPTFSGGAGSAAGDAAQVLVYVYRGPRDTGTPVAVLDAPRTGSSFSVEAHSALPVGTYTARAEQGDAAGNTGHSPSRTFAVTSTAPASAYRETVLADAPRGYWRLGEGGGTTAADEVPDGTPGTYQGGPGLGSAGVVPVAQSTAATLDGVDDVIRIPDSANLDPSSALALELWIRPAALPSSSATLMRKDLQYMLRLTSGGGVAFRLWRGGASTEVTSPAATVKAGVWNHVVASYDGTAVTVYVNGTARSTLALGSPVDTSANPLTLGAGTGSDHYSGRIDEPAVFGTALSAARVQAHYAKASPVIDTPPTVVLESPVAGTTTDGRPEFSGIGGSESVDSTTVTVRIWTGANAGTAGSALMSLAAQRNAAGDFSITPSTTLAVGTYTARAEQTNSAGFTGLSTPATFTVSDGSAPVIAAAGDIADCSGRDDEATADLLAQIPGTVLTLGDNAYQQGSAETYRCYNASWGRFLNRTRSIPGDHDIGDSEAFTDYFDYFGTAAGPYRPAGYYSYNLGNWHVVALNSACYVQLRTCDDAEEEWLDEDLEDNSATCTLALLHEPRFSSGEIHGNNDSVKPLWQILYDHGVDVVLSGSEHLYERFSPQTPAGVSDPDHGIREFIVGTGGESHYQVGVHQGEQPGAREQHLRRHQDDPAARQLRLAVRARGRQDVHGLGHRRLPLSPARRERRATLGP